MVAVAAVAAAVQLQRVAAPGAPARWHCCTLSKDILPMSMVWIADLLTTATVAVAGAAQLDPDGM